MSKEFACTMKKNTKRAITIASFIISGIGLLYIGLVVYVELSGGGPLYLNPCYNTLIIRPLAWLGSESAQEKMVRFWIQEEARSMDDLKSEIKKIQEDLKQIEASKPQEKERTWEDDLRERRNDTALI